MNIKETKAMVNEILDLNVDERFTYAPEITFHDSGTIVSCMVCNKRTGEVKYIQDFRGDIFHRIYDARNALIVNESAFIEAKKVELEAELNKLNAIISINGRS